MRSSPAFKLILIALLCTACECTNGYANTGLNVTTTDIADLSIGIRLELDSIDARKPTVMILVNFARRFNVGPNKTRIAIVNATEVQIQVKLSIENGTSVEAVAKEIKDFTFTRSEPATNDLRRVGRLVRRNSAPRGSDTKRPHVVILFVGRRTPDSIKNGSAVVAEDGADVFVSAGVDAQTGQLECDGYAKDKRIVVKSLRPGRIGRIMVNLVKMHLNISTNHTYTVIERNRKKVDKLMQIGAIALASLLTAAGAFTSAIVYHAVTKNKETSRLTTGQSGLTVKGQSVYQSMVQPPLTTGRLAEVTKKRVSKRVGKMPQKKEVTTNAPKLVKKSTGKPADVKLEKKRTK